MNDSYNSDVMTYVSYTFLFFTLVVVIFQLALAVGTPLGDYTLGGKYPGKLPSKIRWAAIFQILILSIFAIIVLTRSGLIFSQWYGASRLAIWLVTGFFVLGSIANLSSPSLKEKRLWGPVNIMLLVLSILIALS